MANWIKRFFDIKKKYSCSSKICFVLQKHDYRFFQSEEWWNISKYKLSFCVNKESIKNIFFKNFLYWIKHKNGRQLIEIFSTFSHRYNFWSLKYFKKISGILYEAYFSIVTMVLMWSSSDIWYFWGYYPHIPKSFLVSLLNFEELYEFYWIEH